MRLRAFAKINWSLDITGVREDGYHLMDMVMQPVSLFDTVELYPADDLSLSTSGHPLLKADEKHLAHRAARALKEYTSFSGGAAISVRKRIPVGAGMGGGSADAAAVLFGLNQLWHTGLSDKELAAIGLSLGADIPFCLRGGLTRTGGIGEKLADNPCGRFYHLVIVQPCRGLSTAEVFRAWQVGECDRPDTDGVLSALGSGDISLLRASAKNVLQPVSQRMRPEIGTAVRRLRENGADLALMTGSGSAVFGVFRNAVRAQAAAKNLRFLYKTVRICRTQSESICIVNDSIQPLEE